MELDNNYIVLLDDIKLNIQSARTLTIRKVNRELMTLYWSIGQLILEK